MLHTLVSKSEYSATDFAYSWLEIHDLFLRTPLACANVTLAAMLVKTSKNALLSSVRQKHALSCGCVHPVHRTHPASSSARSACGPHLRPDQHVGSLVARNRSTRSSVATTALGNGTNGNGKAAATDAGELLCMQALLGWDCAWGIACTSSTGICVVPVKCVRAPAVARSRRICRAGVTMQAAVQVDALRPLTGVIRPSEALRGISQMSRTL